MTVDWLVLTAGLLSLIVRVGPQLAPEIMSTTGRTNDTLAAASGD